MNKRIRKKVAKRDLARSIVAEHIKGFWRERFQEIANRVQEAFLRGALDVQVTEEPWPESAKHAMRLFDLATGSKRTAKSVD